MCAWLVIWISSYSTSTFRYKPHCFIFKPEKSNKFCMRRASRKLLQLGKWQVDSGHEATDHWSLILVAQNQKSKVHTRTRTNTNPNGTEANAAGRSGNARALRKQNKCGMIQEGERHWPNSSENLQKARNSWVLRGALSVIANSLFRVSTFYLEILGVLPTVFKYQFDVHAQLPPCSGLH